MPATDARDPLQVIEAIYAAGTGQADWQEVLTRIADLCAVENAAMVVVDPAAAYSSVLTPRADPEVVRAYEQDGWWTLDPTVGATGQAPIGVITSLQDTGRDRFLASDFHDAFWSRSGLGAERLASNLMQRGASFASIVLQAGLRRDEIDAQAHDRFALLLPHLVRAIEIEQRLRSLSLQSLMLGVTAGRPDAMALAVDAAARPITDLGEVCRPGDLPRGMTLVAGQLVLPQPALTDRLYAMIADCSGRAVAGRTRGAVLQYDPDGLGALTIEVLPRPAAGQVPSAGLHLPRMAALLVVTDHGARQRLLRARMQDGFGLTPAECTLALEILRGDGRDAAAARLGITVSTARTHLTRIFEKTGTRRQAELVRLFSEDRLPPA